MTWSANCVITSSVGAGIFAKTDTKRYILVVALSTKDDKEI